MFCVYAHNNFVLGFTGFGECSCDVCSKFEVYSQCLTTDLSSAWMHCMSCGCDTPGHSLGEYYRSAAV